MMFKTIILSSFIIANAFAAASQTPEIAVLDVLANFEYGQTSKDFRVHYSGLGLSGQPTASIKIYKNGDNSAVHQFTVTDPSQPKAYYFAMDSVEAGARYEVEVCSADGTTCSPKNPALKTIPPKPKKVTCVQGKYEADGTWVDDSEQPNFEIEMIGPEADSWLTQDKIDTIEAEIRKVKPTYKTDWSKNDVSTNPSYKNQVLYTGVLYNIAHFKKLFEKRQEKQETRTRYSHDICERKYLMTANVHLVSPTTKEVQYRFKTTLFLSEQGKQFYVLDSNASTRRVHVEMTHANVDIADGSYELQIIFCATEKDAIEATFCAEPFIKDFSVSSAK